MNDLFANLFLPLAASWGYWIIARALRIARQTLTWTAGKAWLFAVLLTLTMPHAHAGWFTRGPDPKTEAANRALERAAQLAAPENKTVRLFNATATGLCVQLSAWNYPVVCNLATGQLQYDNYGGHWGEQARLNEFLQAYAVEKAKIEARKKGHTVSETRLQDGSIKVTVRVGGAA